MKFKLLKTITRALIFASLFSISTPLNEVLAADVSGADFHDTSTKSESDTVAQSEIRALLQAQEDDWNKGDIEHFVQGYRKSDDTLFVGATGVKRGYAQILERYQTQYPDRKAMGQLTFSRLEVHVTSANSAYAVGEFDLKLADKPHRAGYFTLNLIRSGGRWEIVADHTTAR